jgi:hypothetical protein
MLNNFSTKLFPALVIVGCLSFALKGQTANLATDPLSGLPLLPGMTASNDPIKVGICKKQGQVNQYSLPYDTTETVAKDVAWYKSHLSGFHYFHATWIDHPQDLFYSPDGTKGVNVTGSKSSDRVFSISYLVIKPGLTEHEMAVFSPSNASCK